MDSVSLLIAIVARNRLSQLLEIYQEQKLEVNLIALGYGTATHATLNMLGLDSTEKAVCFSFVTAGKWPAIKRDLRQKLRIDIPATGIAFTVPLSSIGGKRELAAGQTLRGGRERRGAVGMARRARAIMIGRKKRT